MSNEIKRTIAEQSIEAGLILKLAKTLYVKGKINSPTYKTLVSTLTYGEKRVAA